MHDWLRRIARRMNALAHGSSLDRELDDEMRLHVDLEAEDLQRLHGLDAEEARRRALIAFGGVERYKEAHRDERGVRWIDEWWQDVRYAVRTLLHRPGFTLSAVLVLALGIGASTAVFSAVDAVLISRLPYPHDDQLVRLYLENSPTNRWTLSVADFQAVESDHRTFSAVGAFMPRSRAVFTGSEPTRASTGWATSGFFRALGIQPFRGRLFLPADDRVGAPAVMVVSYAFAQRTYGRADAAIGRSVIVDGTPHTVVGVLSPDVIDVVGSHIDIWPVLQLATPQRRGPFGLYVLARCADGVSLDEARRNLDALSVRIFDTWSPGFQDQVARIVPVPLRQEILRDAGKTLTVLAAAVALVLVISVANLASLLLVRAIGRWRELSLRTALGATRSRLARLLITEGLVLALVGAAVGIAVGAGALKVLGTIGPSIPRLDHARLDLRAVGAAAVLALLTGLAAGAAPVAALLRRHVAPALRDGTRTASSGRGADALRSAFVVAELALALPLLAAAGLLLNSFLRLQRVDPGFEAQHVLTVRVSLPKARYSSPDSIAAYWARALPRVRELAGVEHAALGDLLPPSEGSFNNNDFNLIDRPVPPGGAQHVSPWPSVSEDYFAALGLTLLEGRAIAPGDSGDAPPVVVVSKSWARHYYPDGSAVGRQMISGGCITCPPTTVVGVVSDMKYQGLNGGADAVYQPVTQAWSDDVNLFVRTSGMPREPAARVVAALRSVDAAVALDAAPMTDHLAASITQPRHLALLIGGFALTALALAAVGIFGMLAYTVSTRRREIGVRMALGARPREVVFMVFRRGMGLATAGAAIGLITAVWLTRGLASTLYGVSPADPLTLVVVTALLLGVAAAACWLPARRAAGVNPVEAMRAD